MVANEHGRIIATQATSALAELGLSRIGNSRSWIADHGAWLDVVCFEPSGFQKGTYCSVAVHWLWGPDPMLSFDYGFRRTGWASFVEPESFARDVDAMATKAIAIVNQRRIRLSSLREIAATLAGEADDAMRNGYVSWSAYHCAVASGLIGDFPTAERMFKALLVVAPADPPFVGDRAALAQELLTALDRRPLFLERIQQLLDRQRAFFRLPPHHLA